MKIIGILVHDHRVDEQIALPRRRAGLPDPPQQPTSIPSLWREWRLGTLAVVRSTARCIDQLIGRAFL
jgi:hypothetical protein